MRKQLASLLLVVGWILIVSVPAEAYIGPGAGISVIGTVVAFVGAVIFAIVGFVWYPIKRLLAFARRNRVRDDQPQPES